jgi:hypothetical protein
MREEKIDDDLIQWRCVDELLFYVAQHTWNFAQFRTPSWHWNKELNELIEEGFSLIEAPKTSRIIPATI